jgi:hypothetical protein
MVACGVKLFLFDFDEFHGFVEVVEDVHAFLCDLVALKPNESPIALVGKLQRITI